MHVRRGPFRPQRLVSLRERKSGYWAAYIFRMVDICALAFFGFLGVGAHSGGHMLSLPVGEVLPFLCATVAVAMTLSAFGLYRLNRTEKLWERLLKVAGSIGMGAVAGFAVTCLIKGTSTFPPALEMWSMACLAFFSLLHLLWFTTVARWRKQGRLTPNIVIVGATKHAQRLIDGALARRDVNILGIFDDRLARNPDTVLGVPVLGDTKALLSHKITPYVDQIVVAVDPSAKARVKDIITRLKSLPNEVSLLVDMHNDEGRQAALSRMADQPLARVSGITEDDKRAFNKRIQDMIIGLMALIVFAPVMVLIAGLIKLDSPGPVFFRQRRHGFNNEPIMVWKFRSMRQDAEDATASQQVTAGDERVTRIGRIIRKTSLDELPQLFNVIMGEMSLVGPRPHAIGMKTGPDESARLVAEYAWRHRMKPGMTGWAAVNGSRGPLHNADDVRRRISLDVDYIERQSFWLDLYIMMMTLPCILGDRKAIR
ncbi:undecaprenyl-phosphate glucose phosphotransferase [Asticcacaulis sp. SL142]|nr:undecaprenyl-phosphate glucose phosphotransferase [Asticcacaulis sp. SL142]